MEIRYTVKGIRNDVGVIRGLVFTQDNGGFPEVRKKATAEAVVKAKSGEVTLVFKGVESKQAAFAFFHDEKNTGKIEKSFFGMPKQGITMSNWNGRSRPNFKSSLVSLKVKLSSSLKYF